MAVFGSDGYQPSILGTGSGTAGQVKIAVTGTAVPGPNLPAKNGIIVSASPLNAAFAGSVGGTVGTSAVTNTVNGTGNGAFLPPGSSLSFAVQNANELYVNGSANDAFSFAVS